MQKVPYNDAASFPDVKTDPLTSNVNKIMFIFHIEFFFILKIIQ
jgi:hypothetical protein